MKDELVLFGSGLDQPIPDDAAFWEERVDEILEKAFRDHDAEYAINACENLVKIAKVTGKALATLLYKIKAHWDIFDTIDTFEERAYPRIGLHWHTIERYIRIAEMFESQVIPKEFEGRIKQRNMGELIPIANAIAQGHKFDDEDWQRIVDAPDFQTISKEVREIKGQEPRKSGLILMINEGTLWAMDKDNREFVGSLDVESRKPIVQKAINRILDSAGILRQ